MDPENPQHRYIEISDELERRIDAGTYPPGTALPGELTLAEEFGVARMTVHRATGVLRDRGRIRTLRGRGHIVLAIEQSADRSATEGTDPAE